MRSLVVVAVLLLAGCTSDPAPLAPVVEEPGVITDPSFGLNQTGAHIHDYWGGGDRVTVLDATHPGGDEPGTGPGLAGGQDVEVRSFQPVSGDVVPQGTARVEVTLTWTDAELDSYTAPVLYVKTAGMNQSSSFGAVESGVPLAFETGAADADLPHQLLSAWLFELRMSSPDPAPLRFKGAVTIKADAVRGLPLPVFPPHPDPWGDGNEIALVDGSGQLSYFEDLVDGGCNGLSCPTLFRPFSGAIVPTDARHVAVEVTYTGQVPLQLHYHSASSREMAAAQPVTTQGGLLVYELALDHDGDGPYAQQSQWEFTVLPAETVAARTAWTADYTITAKAVR